MAFTADFTRLTNWKSDSGTKAIRFAAGAPALETEFNELQFIIDKRLHDLITMFGDGLLGEGAVTYDNGKLSIDNERAIVGGNLIYISHLDIDLIPGESAYLDVFEKEIGYKDVMRRYGNEQEVAITNYILDSRFGKEISRRVVLAYDLVKRANNKDHFYLKIGSMSVAGFIKSVHFVNTDMSRVFDLANTIGQELLQLKRDISTDKVFDSAYILNFVQILRQLKSDIEMEQNLDSAYVLNMIQTIRQLKSNVEMGHEFSNVYGMNLVQDIRQLKRTAENSYVESGSITLNNSLSYPFNNSVTTVPLRSPRRHLDYVVTVDAPTDPRIGAIRVYDKQTNGFKIEFEGDASSVTLKYYVSGGMN